MTSAIGYHLKMLGRLRAMEEVLSEAGALVEIDPGVLEGFLTRYGYQDKPVVSQDDILDLLDRCGVDLEIARAA